MSASINPQDNSFWWQKSIVVKVVRDSKQKILATWSTTLPKYIQIKADMPAYAKMKELPALKKTIPYSRKARIMKGLKFVNIALVKGLQALLALPLLALDLLLFLGRGINSICSYLHLKPLAYLLNCLICLPTLLVSSLLLVAYASLAGGFLGLAQASCGEINQKITWRSLSAAIGFGVIGLGLGLVNNTLNSIAACIDTFISLFTQPLAAVYTFLSDKIAYDFSLAGEVPTVWQSYESQLKTKQMWSTTCNSLPAAELASTQLPPPPAPPISLEGKKFSISQPMLLNIAPIDDSAENKDNFILDKH